MSSFVELQNENCGDETDNGYQVQQRSQGNKCTRFLRNRIVTSACFLIVFAITIPLLLFFVLFHLGYSVNEQRHTCLVASSYRVPCGGINITSENCVAVNCCFDEETEECYHYIPSLYYYQATTDSETTGYYYAVQEQTPFNTTSTNALAVSIVELDENQLKVVLHRTNVTVDTSNVVATKSYEFKIYDEDFLYVQVVRTSTGDSLFTTHKGPLIASAGYWEWTFQLTTENLFGLGELTFAENTTYTKVIYKNQDDHNTLPMFMAYVNGSYHGAVVEHEGPLEVTVLPSNLIILRALVGDSVSVTISTGPTPADVVKQQRVSEPTHLPFWALGPHICRKTGNTLKEALDHYYSSVENVDESVQYASDCIHENLMFLLQNANDTLKTNVKEIITNIKANSRFMLSFQPQVDYRSDNPLYEAAVQFNLLYKDAVGQPLNGSYKNNEVVFIDFSLENVSGYFEEMHSTVLDGIEYDGVALTDNWPAEDSYVMQPDESFPFISEQMNSSLSKTIPWNATSDDGTLHLTKHNTYATSQLQLFKNRLGEEAFLITSAFDYGLNNAALIQDFDISWESLRKSIRTILYHNLFANPLISIPICGSTDNYVVETHETICIRWYIVAATSPLFRVSSVLPLRDPQHLTTGYARNAALKAIAERRKLSLYLHSVLKSGEPLMRPLFYDFYGDNNTLTIDTQYMVGPALMVAQILLPAVNTISVYLPPEAGMWYEYFGGGNYTELGWRLFSVVETDWLMFIPQGSIIPLRNDNGADTITLAIAFNCSVECHSTGSLQYGSVEITLLADTNGITIRNANSALNDIGCGNTLQWPTTIVGAVIYGMNENLVEIDLSPVDLCDIEVDAYVISF